MKKKVISKVAALAIIFLMISSPVYAYAHVNTISWYPFTFNIEDMSKGYNSVRQYKHANYPLYWVDVQTNNFGNTVPTNFIVINADNGVQIAYNTNIYGCTNAYNSYYTAAHVGWVRLRANSGSTVVGYKITGEWSHEAFYCGD